MIVIDSSALIAVLAKEPERDRFVALIAHAERRLVSAVSFLETRIVIHARFGRGGVTALDALLDEMGAEIITFDAEQSRAAFAAFELYGKGALSKARLNMGDCAAYALAKTIGGPLLFKGDDFSHTDIAALATVRVRGPSQRGSSLSNGLCRPRGSRAPAAPFQSHSAIRPGPQDTRGSAAALNRCQLFSPTNFSSQWMS